MRAPFYESLENQETLRTVARSWLGTPFRKGASIKGVGVDCVHLARAIYKESNFDIVDTFPPYSLDEGSHAIRSKIVDWLQKSERFDEVDVSERKNGDLLVFNMGSSTHHVGVQITESTFINAIKRYGVVELNIHDTTWSRRLTFAYRPMEIYFIPA